jgi:hypothetical protein
MELMLICAIRHYQLDPFSENFAVPGDPWNLTMKFALRVRGRISLVVGEVAHASPIGRPP